MILHKKKRNLFCTLCEVSFCLFTPHNKRNVWQNFNSSIQLHFLFFKRVISISGNFHHAPTILYPPSHPTPVTPTGWACICRYFGLTDRPDNRGHLNVEGEVGVDLAKLVAHHALVHAGVLRGRVLAHILFDRVTFLLLRS